MELTFFCWKALVVPSVVITVNYVSHTVKPRHSAPAFNLILPIERTNFSPKKYFHSYLYVGNNKNLGIEYNFTQSFEMRYSCIRWAAWNAKLFSEKLDISYFLILHGKNGCHDFGHGLQEF